MGLDDSCRLEVVAALRTPSIHESTGLSNYCGFGMGYQQHVQERISLVHRYYDPATEQFLSVDPAVNLTEAPYSFVNGDPVNATDQTGLFGWGTITGALKSVTKVIHEVAKVTTTIAGGCAAVAGIIGAEPVAGACGVVAVASAGVQVATGAVLAATNNESWGQFGLDAASLGLSATGLGLARLSASLGESAEAFGDAAESTSWWQPLAKAGLYLRQGAYSGLSSLSYLAGLGVELGGNTFDWDQLVNYRASCL